MDDKKITLGDAVKTIEVELFGSLFHAVPATRSVMKAVSDYQSKLEAVADDADDDERIQLMANLFDARLEATNGGRKKPSAIIMEKWKADALSIAQLSQLDEELTEVQFARPT